MAADRDPSVRRDAAAQTADPLAALAEPAGAWVWDGAADRLYADARFASLCGLDPQEARRGLPTTAFVANVDPLDQLRMKIAVAGVAHGSDVFDKEYRVRGSDGATRWVSARGKAERASDGSLARFTGVLVDVTEQKRVEEQLRIAQTAGGVGSFEHTDGFGTADVSHQFCRLLGLYPTDALSVRTINSLVHIDDPLLVRSGRESTEDTGYSELRIRRADTGEERWLARRGEHRNDSVGGGGRYIGVIYDITDAKNAEAELRTLAQTLEERVEERTKERDRIWNRAKDLFFVASRDGAYQAINPAWTAVLGYTEAELLGRRDASLIHPDDEAAVADLGRRLLAGNAVLDEDSRVRAKDGSYRWINWTIVPEGEFFYGMGRDTTDRRQLEDQLRQSQKMEAVGQLTGGLAHDFNNMLTGVMGGLDMARRRMAQGRPEDAARYMDAATTAAERAAALTHRLLAFSRRQTLDPQRVEINGLVSSMADMLGRTLGEHISLDLSLASDLWPTRTDPNQLENAILNLAINARDAMPDGGRLSIATENVALDRARPMGPERIEPGDYVVVAVGDTGVGMTSDVIAQAFDPFFTTKPIGQGTGLGLSMVYGFVRQSGGHVEIVSEPGVGTTIHLYLPRQMSAAETPSPTSRKQAPQGAGESVLLVEDDPQVRVVAASVLQELGYVAIEAADSQAAIAVLEGKIDINLLITDVGLPGMNGRQLAEVARQTRPDLPVLFVTGYAANIQERSSFLAPGMQMISKPFSLDGLARAVREILER
jgi:PAS domain S-box-containing protein